MGPSSQTPVAAALAAAGGIIARRDHPELVDALAWLVRRGVLKPVLSGIYAPADSASDLRTRIRAAMLWDVDAVLTGATAARVSFWPTIAATPVQLATCRQHRARPPGFVLHRRTINPELVRVRGGLRFTAPALTALDLCESCGGDGIDTVLRSRAATLAQLHEAMRLTAGRVGNAHRRMLLLDSRDEPWSAAERSGHQLLRAAGLEGWRSNLPVWLLGRLYYLDIAFEAVKLAVEIDGRLHEDDPDVFENDRWRQNALVQDGWRVLRFTWRMLTDYPDEVVQAVLGSLAQPRNVTPVDLARRCARGNR